MALQVYRFMTPGPHVIGRDRPLAEAKAIMDRFHVRHLPVLDNGVLVGIVTERDLHLLETVGKKDPESVLVEEAMTLEPYFVAPDASIHDVAAALVEYKYGCAVVMEKGHVAGIFTTIDALRALLSLQR